MNNQNKQLIQDILIIILSITFAIFAIKNGLFHKIILSMGDLRWLGIIFAGIFFTSFFTTALSIAILASFAENTPLPILVLFGGIGAMIGDYIIFTFIKDRVSKDFEYLLSFSKPNRFSAIFKTRIFKFFMPLLGAIIIASPLPDEIGVAMLGISKIKDKFFLVISFLANGIGILIIGLIVQTILR